MDFAKLLTDESLHDLMIRVEELQQLIAVSPQDANAICCSMFPGLHCLATNCVDALTFVSALGSVLHALTSFDVKLGVFSNASKSNIDMDDALATFHSFQDKYVAKVNALSQQLAVYRPFMTNTAVNIIYIYI